MADEAQLTLQKRTVMGKRVKQLRREGIVPGNVYGRRLESVSVQAPLAEVRRVFRSVPRNSVVRVLIEGEKETRPVVLRLVDRNPVSGEVRHVELYQVDLSRPIHSEAALVLVGDSEAVHNGGTLVQNMDVLMLEALPTEMPAEIEVDITRLENFGDAIHVGDLTLPANVTAVADEASLIATVVAPRVEEEEEEVAEELELAEGEEAPAEGEAAGQAEEAGEGESED